MLLTDIMHAVHCGLVPNYSINELFIKMPSSNHHFRIIYNSLLHGYVIPKDVRSREDILLLLTALLGDIIYMQRCHLSVPFGTNSSSGRLNALSILRSPYAPLSSGSEFSRLSSDMLAALSRWEQNCQQHAGSDIRALYYFTKVQLMCPNLWELPHQAGYGAASATNLLSFTHGTGDCDIPDKAINLAWLVFDNCGKTTKSPDHKLAVWLPIVLFMSSLVIWKKLRAQPATDPGYGTLGVLSMFKTELAKLPWPCCTEMITTLDRLMEN